MEAGRARITEEGLPHRCYGYRKAEPLLEIWRRERVGINAQTGHWGFPLADPSQKPRSQALVRQPQEVSQEATEQKKGGDGMGDRGGGGQMGKRQQGACRVAPEKKMWNQN